MVVITEKKVVVTIELIAEEPFLSLKTRSRLNPQSLCLGFLR